MNLKQAANTMLIQSLALRAGENCLVACDPRRLRLAETVAAAAKEITRAVRLLTLPAPGPKGWSPLLLEKLEAEMLGQDVVLLLTGQSLSHTEARRGAVAAGARVVSMPGASEELLLRAAVADYHRVSTRSIELKEIFSAGEAVAVYSEPGTEVFFSIEGMEGHSEDGLYHRRGSWGNLPAGEACVGPREGSARGVIVLDWSMSGIGRLREPLVIRVEQGLATEIVGRDAGRLRARLDRFGTAAYTLAEFGLGTNDQLQLSGRVLEDEKVLGTAHFALGNNIGFGGSVAVPLHLDGVLRQPTVIVDGKTIMRHGLLLTTSER